MEAQRLFCRKPGPGGDYCVTVRDGKLCLTLPNDNDPHQIWYRASDDEVHFLLINKTTRKVASYYYSYDTDGHVCLVEPTGNLSWRESEDLGDGYKVFRLTMWDNSYSYTMEVPNGIISDGALLYFSYTSYHNSQLGENAHWKFVPVTAPSPKPTHVPTPSPAPVPTPTHVPTPTPVPAAAPDPDPTAPSPKPTHVPTPTPTPALMEAQRLFCRKPGPEGDYCVTVRDGKLCLTLPNDNDPHQIWYREDDKGYFLLINKTTRKVANVYSDDYDDYHVLLVDKPGPINNNLLWLVSEDLGDGYEVFRLAATLDIMKVSNGIISDGSLLSMSHNSYDDSEIGENAQWKFIPVTAPSTEPTHVPTPTPTPALTEAQRLFCRRVGPGGDYCVTVRDGKLCLTLPNDNDPHQIWYREFDEGSKESDDEVYFLLINKTTRKLANAYKDGTDGHVQLVDKPGLTYHLWWQESVDLGDGYKVFRLGTSPSCTMEVSNGIISDGSLLSFSYKSCLDSQIGEDAHWKFVPTTAPAAPPALTPTRVPTPVPQRLFCRRPGTGGQYCVTVRGERLCLTLPNKHDPYQIWYKEADEDDEVYFLLINKTTRKVAAPYKYANRTDDHVRLVEIHWRTDLLRWQESEDLGDGFKVFRQGLISDGYSETMEVSNGIISDGSYLSLSYNSYGDSQLGENAHWKFVPVTAPSSEHTPVYKQPSNMIYCLAGDAQYSVAAKEGKIVLAYPNPKDPTQHWYKDDSQATKAGSFMLVNKDTFQAAKQSVVDQPLQLVNRPTTPDRSLSWTESEIDIYGFRFIVTDNDSGLAMDARDRKGAHVDRYISYSKNSKADIQKWQFVPY